MMSVYSVVLFFHVVAAFALSAGLSLETLILARSRRTTKSSDVAKWMNLVPRLPIIAIGSLLILLFSGGYMVGSMSGWGLAWPKVALGGLIAMGPLGAVTGRRMRVIRKLCGTDNSNISELLGRLRDPYLKISLGVRAGIFFGIVMLMTAKPDLNQALIIVGVFALLGFALASLPSRQKHASTAVDMGD